MAEATMDDQDMGQREMPTNVRYKFFLAPIIYNN
jgi:hypothetical protein